MAEEMEVKFRIENIVASANLEVELNLYAIAREVGNVEYEPEQFPGAILKLKDPKTSLLLFKNGKLICTGAKSEGEVDKAIKKAVDLVKPYIVTDRKKMETAIKKIPTVNEPKMSAGSKRIIEPKNIPWDKRSKGNLALNLSGGAE